MDWFNDRRLLEAVGTIPPAEAEANSYAALEPEDMAAQLTEISLRSTRHGSVRHEALAERRPHGTGAALGLEREVVRSEDRQKERERWFARAAGARTFSETMLPCQ